jgi:SanA protein
MFAARLLLARASKAVVAIGAATFVFVGVCNLWVSHASAGLSHRALAPGKMRDVAIVPGTFARKREPGAMLRARLEMALQALVQGRVRAILVSGNEAAGEVSVMRSWLERQGVDPTRILDDPEGTRTIETMRNAARRFGVTSAVVCTQPISMGRTIFLAQASGIDATGLIADFDIPHNVNWVGREALKSTLAVMETALP